MKIRHILVVNEYEASDLARKLGQGVAFEDLARKFSTCPSSKAGGDLGDLTDRAHLLDQTFREAAENLAIGETSKPVRTRFGHHLILRYG